MSDTEDDALDVTSTAFDPLKALYSTNVHLPCPSAPVLDNLSKYTTLSKPSQDRDKKQAKKKESEPGPSTSSDAPARRFLPHQMPVPGTRPARTMRDLLTRMQDPPKGPMSVLKDCMERRLRVKVFTRHMCGVRGYCEAFVAAFDKHWNLALEDVREVWRRKRRTKVPAIGPPEPPKRHVRGRPPPIVVIRTEKLFEECERHVGQLMMRGEHVVLVAVQGY